LAGRAGCQQQKDPGPDYADDEAMEIIADGIEARSDLVDKDEADGKDAFTMKTLKSYVEAELEVDEKLRTRVFEDSQMQESVLAYINTLDDALKVIESNSVTSAEFYDAWDKVYDKRTSLLKLFVDEYGLSVGEKHQEVFDEMIATIREDAVHMLLTIEVRQQNQEPKREQVAKPTGEGAPAQAGAKGATPVRVTKIGRNDPCPCGSGLKWKKCTCKEYHPDL